MFVDPDVVDPNSPKPERDREAEKGFCDPPGCEDADGIEGGGAIVKEEKAFVRA